MVGRVLKFLIVVGLASLAFGQTQEAKPLARHPGDVIKYQVTFDGPNASKIKLVNAGLGLKGTIPKDQAGFSGGFGSSPSWVGPSPTGTFTVQLTVPNNIATGDYALNVSVQADEGSASYSEGQDFKLPLIHIENPKTFTPPGIDVKQLP